MSYPDESAYYWLRAAAELERGDQAPTATIAAVHYELAYRYGVAAVHASDSKPRLMLVEREAIHIAA